VIFTGRHIGAEAQSDLNQVQMNSVIPAKAGIQIRVEMRHLLCASVIPDSIGNPEEGKSSLDSRFRGNDKNGLGER